MSVEWSAGVSVEWSAGVSVEWSFRLVYRKQSADSVSHRPAPL